jgi:hypothetical protein
MADAPRTDLERELMARGKNPGWLAAETGYSYLHTWQVVAGRRRASRRFQRAAARALGVPDAAIVPSPSSQPTLA